VALRELPLAGRARSLVDAARGFSSGRLRDDVVVVLLRFE
jgi:hypothetical protein